jgi:NAD(P)H-dependent FMN reductase
MAKLQIIAASIRPTRIGYSVAQWIYQNAEVQHGFSEVELVDLADVNLPMMDEPHHPRLGNYVHQHTRTWSAKVMKADAFIFVMPEYNFGYSAPLKNAIDYLHAEWLYKPVGLVSYGGVSAGTRAAQMIKQVVSALKMVPATEAVAIPFVQQHLDNNGDFIANETILSSAEAMLDELVRLAEVLRPLRARNAHCNSRINSTMTRAFRE